VALILFTTLLRLLAMRSRSIIGTIVFSKSFNDRKPEPIDVPRWRGLRLILVARPDFTNTEPAANIGPFPQWADKKKIVSMDPLGHLAPWLFKDTIEKEYGELVLKSALSV
jgi:hypothetical protein